MQTTGNTIFISGGSAGIGLAIAKRLYEAGNHIIINGRDKARLAAAVDQMPQASAIAGDLSVGAERTRIAEELTTLYPDVNMIINNAGFAHAYRLDPGAQARDKALQEMETNYFSVIHFTELLLPHLLKKQSAAIINVSSIVALRANTAVPTYAASKAALHSYTQALRETYLEYPSLHIYEVYPPLVNTAFSQAIGGASGIAPEEVADELFIALQEDRFDVPVGQTKALFA